MKMYGKQAKASKQPAPLVPVFQFVCLAQSTGDQRVSLGQEFPKRTGNVLSEQSNLGVNLFCLRDHFWVIPWTLRIIPLVNLLFPTVTGKCVGTRTPSALPRVRL